MDFIEEIQALAARAEEQLSGGRVHKSAVEEAEELSVTMVYPPPRWLIHQGISPTPSPG